MDDIALALGTESVYGLVRGTRAGMSHRSNRAPLLTFKGSKIDPDQFFAARRTYYEMAGWDPSTGRPTASKLAELSVEEAAAGQK